MRKLLPLTIAVAAAATTFGMAATLGGVTSDPLGVDASAVATCDSNGVTTSYTIAYDATDGRYEVSAVTVSGIDNACDGKSLSVTLTNSSGTSLGSGTLTIPNDASSTSSSVSISAAPSAQNAANVHVVIS